MNAAILTFAARGSRNAEDSYDPSTLGIPLQCAKPLLEAFQGLTAHYRRLSRRQFWRSIVKFARFISLSNDPFRKLSSREVVIDFRKSLHGTMLDKTAGSHYNHVAAIYRWLAVHDDERTILWANVKTPPFGSPREVERPRARHLNQTELEHIARVATSRVDRIRLRLKQGSAALVGNEAPGLTPKQVRLIRVIAEGEQKGVFGKKRLFKSGQFPWNNSYRGVAPYVRVQMEDYIPFILLILLDTTANPFSIFEIRIDAVADHPSDPHRRRIYWQKGRAASEQASDVSSVGRNSTPSLLHELKELTSAMRAHASAESRDLVFLGVASGKIRGVSVQTFHNYLDKFIEEEALPDFNFVDIRHAIASAMHARGESLLDISKQLQHASARTTLGYVNSEPDREKTTARLIEFHGQLSTEVERPPGEDLYDTVYGFRCSDQFAGEAPRSRKGEPCLQYFHCALCPNSIVVVDSPKHISRLLAAQQSLRAHELASLPFSHRVKRYREVYSPIANVLDQILSRVSPKVMEKALLLSVDVPPVPMEE